jgi:hypothetical protein
VGRSAFGGWAEACPLDRRVSQRTVRREKHATATLPLLHRIHVMGIAVCRLSPRLVRADMAISLP